MRTHRAGGRDESGVVLIIVALAMVVLMGMVAIAVDASYGFVQNRRAQNAADFAAFAASQQLDNSAYCYGSSQPSMAQIVAIIQQLVTDNDGSQTAWTAQFLNSTGAPSGQTFNAGNYQATFPSTPPPDTCGVNITANPTWPSFFGGITGLHHLRGFATGSVAPTSTKGNPISIVALNEVGPHEVLGGGTGQFIVSGTIFLNTNVASQPWTSSSGGDEWDDAIDAKANSNLYVYGTILTNNSTFNGQKLWPLDGCFESQGVIASGPNNTLASGLKPGVQMSCGALGGSSVTVDYNAIANSFPQITDPLQAPTAPPSPFNPTTMTNCPGMTLQTNPAPLVVGTTTEYLPGLYTSPVAITGATATTTFEDCSGYSGQPANNGQPEGAYPGVYDFQAGLEIDPGAGDTVNGSNIVIATQQPYPVGGNVPGSVTNGTFSASGPGNGAPCLPAGTETNLQSGNGTNMAETSPTATCAGTSPQAYGAMAYQDTAEQPDPSETGTGTNYSLIIGGASGSSVTLSGPTSGAYANTNGTPGVVLYQDKGTAANYGFDAEVGDAADITINGVVYNASLPNDGVGGPLDFWDGTGGGVVFYQGGTLQTGYGTGWVNGPTQSAGSVSLNGTAIVDDFNTDGGTNITITGLSYSLTGAQTLSLIG